MSSRHCLKIITDFASAHTLRDYPGDCSRMHGHNWKVEVEVTATKLDDVGMGIDFKLIKNATKDVAKKLDHRYLNEIEGLENPTSEVLARWIWQRLEPNLPGLRRIELAETCRTGCVYEGG